MTRDQDEERRAPPAAATPVEAMETRSAVDVRIEDDERESGSAALRVSGVAIEKGFGEWSWFMWSIAPEASVVSEGSFSGRRRIMEDKRKEFGPTSTQESFDVQR